MSAKHEEPAVVAPPLPDEPYRGIKPFRFVDQQIFAARHEETWTLLSNVTLYRAVLLYGASGTGKSSLINAGLLPLALAEQQIPDRLRVQPVAGREFKVERIQTSDTGEAAAYLPSNFAPSESDTAAESIELSLADFRARLEQFRPTADEPGADGTLFGARTRARPLLIFDQFEEFITLFEEAQRGGTTEESRPAQEEAQKTQTMILATLVELIQDETLPIKIIFSFREDYLAKLSLLFDYCPELLDQTQRLTPPRIETLPQIIRAPFTEPSLRAHFLNRGGDAGSELSEELAEKIGAELGRRSEGNTANLTELQIVCQRLWQEHDPEKLFAAKGIEGLLEGYGVDVFLHLTPALRDVAIVLLSQMITASNTRNIISEEDLLARSVDCDFDTGQCAAALSALAGSQIVRRERRHDIYFYEITSEYLVPWIKERVAERKAAEASRLAEEQRYQALIAESKQRRTRLLKQVVGILILLLIIAVAIAGKAYQEYKHAARAETDAKQAQQDTQKIVDALLLVMNKNPDENLQGIAQIDKLIKDQKIPADLASVVIQPALTSRDDRVRKAANDVLEQNATNSTNVQESITRAAETSEVFAKQAPPRFYIHIADEGQRGQAQQLAAALKQKGYLVPGIQKVNNAPKANELRSFRRDEPGMPKSTDIVALLKKLTGSAWRDAYVGGLESSTKISPGQFEIWFAAVAVEPDQNGTSGTVVLILKDEDGNKVEVTPKVQFISITAKSYVGTDTKVVLPMGIYKVVLEVPGYQTISRFLTLLNGKTQELQVKLIKIKVTPAVSPDQPKQEPLEKKKRVESKKKPPTP